MTVSNAGPWEAIRRTLGRLVSAVQVRDLPPAGPMMRIAGADALTAPPPDSGRREERWRPGATVTHLSPPWAGSGGGDADLAAVAVVVGLNTALRPQAVPVWVSPLPVPAAVHRQDCFGPASPPPPVWAAPATIAPGVVCSAFALPTPPAVARLMIEVPRLPKSPPPVGPRRGRSEAGSPLPFTGVRVRAGISACAGVPLIRTRRPTPPGLRLAQAFDAERRRLAQAAQVDLQDVVLWGVYPQVPVAAVRRLALNEDGQALSLWLKPEALSAAAAGRPPRLATLIIGRLRSTGRMIQAVA